MSILVSNLQLAGRYTLAQRIADAERASLEMARTVCLEIGRMMARRDRDGAIAAMFTVAAHYRNAGDASMAAHWTARANHLRSI